MANNISQRIKLREFDADARRDLIDLMSVGGGTVDDCAMQLGIEVEDVRAALDSGRESANYHDRLFYLRVRQAQAQADAIPRSRLVKEALNGADWRAAEALMKARANDARKEQLRLESEERIRLLQAQRRLQETRAEIAERQLKVVGGRLVMPRQLVEIATDSEVALIRDLLKRANLVPMQEDELDPVSEDELAEQAELLKELGHGEDGGA